MHWSETHKAKQQLRWDVGCSMSGLDIPPLSPPLNVSITVAWEKYRKMMDGDNLLASLKAAIDIIAFKIGVNDKYFVFAPIEQMHDPDGQGYMIFTLEEA